MNQIKFLKGKTRWAKNREQAPRETKACKTSPQNQEFACSGNNEQIYYIKQRIHVAKWLKKYISKVGLSSS